MDNFKLLNNLDDAILVVNNKDEILFQNIPFKKLFGSLKNINRIKKYFNFNICILEADNISNITPLDLLLDSKENFFAYCSYQKGKDDYLFFNLSSIRRKNYKLIFFRNVTSETKFAQFEAEYKDMFERCQRLSKENKKFLQLKEQAQEQALKMALLNRISNIIRDSTNIDTIISSTLAEIQMLLGASKTYYAVKQGRFFKVENAFPQKCKDFVGQKIEFEDSAIENIKSKKISMTACIKEYKDSEQILSKNTKRIIIPISNKNDFIGVIVTLTIQKDILKDNIDILDSIATQLAVSIMQATLFQQIQRKNIKLQKTLNELKETQLQLINSEKMASLGQLVAGVAHEINTPLASINSNSDMVKKILSKNNSLTPELIQMVKNLNNIDQEAIKRISNIVKSLKKFVRLDEAELQDADINNEIDLTLQLLTHETKNKIDIIKDYGVIPKIPCYVNMLNQVFMNILVNACQSINEKDSSGQIVIKTSFQNEKLIVSFKDNGNGIPKELQNKIFSAGFTTKRKGLGTGLGLAISTKIIQKHKGSIAFNSEEGIGTEFIISIPVKI